MDGLAAVENSGGDVRGEKGKVDEAADIAIGDAFGPGEV